MPERASRSYVITPVAAGTVRTLFSSLRPPQPFLELVRKAHAELVTRLDVQTGSDRSYHVVFFYLPPAPTYSLPGSFMEVVEDKPDRIEGDCDQCGFPPTAGE